MSIKIEKKYLDYAAIFMITSGRKIQKKKIKKGYQKQSAKLYQTTYARLQEGAMRGMDTKYGGS